MNPVRDSKKVVALIQKALRRRKAYANYKSARSAQGGLPHGHFQIAVYFADSDVNIYQMRQWYEPLKRLNERWPVLIVSRNPEGAATLIKESGLEVTFAPHVKHLEKLIAKQPLNLVMYVNQNTRNFQMLRYGERWHVFINHGESDKMYMTTNQIKTYDYALIAGEAARNRLDLNVWGYDVDARTFQIGRPQADFMAGDAPYPQDARINVLYAPTWEGDRPAAAYGSIKTHGESLANAILRSPKHRLIYRPHPRSGVLDEAYAVANKRIKQAIKEANQEDPSAHHIMDEAGAITWQISQTDVAICDISAMIYDRLAVGKPVLVTRPLSIAAQVDEHGYLKACEWLTADRAANILKEIDRVLHDQATQSKLAFWAENYFGDITPGAQTLRFEQAIEELFSRWDATRERMNQKQII